jgi:hypothetical protein
MNPGRNVSSVAPEVETMTHCADSADPKQTMESRPHQTTHEEESNVSGASLTWHN